jgi:LuxR family transcriptional regulator, maltose regulon positive regulatory protein
VTQLLEVKLQPPHLRPSAVDRVRLLDRLGRDDVPKLVLVSAPPGFGKSTLAAQWIAALRIPVSVAWVSLDATDADPIRFWRYVATAVERAAPGAGTAALEHLDAGDGSVERATMALANGLAAVDRDLLLVLDDLHAVDGREISEGLTFLLDHLPPRAHLVVLTRADPALPIARLRARGELAELRAADLRFTPGEAAVYLNERMGLALEEADVGTLETRTEGWIAALQLAAISLRDRADPGAFVAGFAGDDRHIVDYLADEVLERQPDAVREFLLATSILERLTGPLCDALTGGSDGTAMLELLDRSNLFLIALDDRRRWYRYHHLFAGLLRARLLDQRPGAIADLHRMASAWWQANGEPREAIEHALAADDSARAADLIEVAAHALRRTRQEATLRRWLDALPDAVFEHRPILAIAHAGALLSTGEPQGVEKRLTVAERWAFAASGPEARARAEAEGMIVHHTTAVAHLPGAVALYRAAIARLSGDNSAAIRQAEAALAVARADQPLERGAAAGMLALAQWTAGDLDSAHANWSAAVDDLERAGHRADLLGGFLAMADIRSAQGRLGEARRTLERGLRISLEGEVPLRGAADMHVALAELDLEQDDLGEALAHLAAADALGEGLGLPQNPHRSRLAMAGIRAAEGDLAAAHTLLDDADRVYASDFFPEVRPIGAMRARLWVAQDRTADALAWAAERRLSADDPPIFAREYEHVTLAVALLAGGDARPEVALALVDRLLRAAEAGGRTRAVIELAALRASALDRIGDRPGAAASLERALAHAAPEGFVRTLTATGAAIVPLLRAAAKGGPCATYATRVLAAYGPGDGIARTPAPVPSPAAGLALSAAPTLLEPLSERELDVLRLLASDLDGPAIAAQLFVSVNTMRSHTKSIFAKLGVNSRRAAVTRAGELGLLSRAG